MQEKGDFILKVEGLSVSFATTAGKVHALRNVDFAVLDRNIFEVPADEIKDVKVSFSVPLIFTFSSIP